MFHFLYFSGKAPKIIKCHRNKVKQTKRLKEVHDIDLRKNSLFHSRTCFRQKINFLTFQIVMVDNYAEILETSLKVIFDLFLVFGIEAFAEDDNEEKKKEKNEVEIRVNFLPCVCSCRASSQIR